MRTPSSALPAWPNGLLEGLGKPLVAAVAFVAAAFARDLRGAAARTARRWLRSARRSDATRRSSLATAFFGARNFLADGLALRPGAFAAARLTVRFAAAAFLLTRVAALVFFLLAIMFSSISVIRRSRVCGAPLRAAPRPR